MSSSRPCTARVRSVHMQTKAPQLTEGSTTHEKKHHTRTLPDTLAPKTNRGRRGERERERERARQTQRVRARSPASTAGSCWVTDSPFELRPFVADGLASRQTMPTSCFRILSGRPWFDIASKATALGSTWCRQHLLGPCKRTCPQRHTHQGEHEQRQEQEHEQMRRRRSIRTQEQTQEQKRHGTTPMYFMSTPLALVSRSQREINARATATCRAASWGEMRSAARRRQDPWRRMLVATTRRRHLQTSRSQLL